MKSRSRKVLPAMVACGLGLWFGPTEAGLAVLGECSYDRGHFARMFILMRDGRSGRLDPNSQFDVAMKKRREFLALSAWTSFELYEFVNADAQRLLSTLRITGDINDQEQVSMAVQKQADEIVKIAQQLGCLVFSQ